MIKIEPTQLKNIVTSYITSFKSAAGVNVEITSVKQDQNNLTVDGEYWIGFSNTRHKFKAIFDSAYNLIEMDLNNLRS